MQMQAKVAKQSTKRRHLNHRGKEVVRNGMNDTCIIIQRGHHLVSTSRTKPRVNLTISLQIKLSRGIIRLWRCPLVCTTGPLAQFDWETDLTFIKLCYVADRIEFQRLSLAPLVDIPVYTINSVLPMPISLIERG